MTKESSISIHGSMRRLIFFIAGLVFMSGAAFPEVLSGTVENNSNKIVVDDKVTFQDISGDLYFYVDNSSKKTFHEILSINPSEFKRSSNPPEIFPLADRIIWARFYVDVKNSHKDYFILINYFVMNNITVYTSDSKGGYNTTGGGHGDFLKSDRVRSRFNVVPVSLPEGKSGIYIAIDSKQDIVRMQTYLADSLGLGGFAMDDSLFYGFYGAFILIQIILALTLFIITKSRTYIYYILYLICFPATLMIATGGLGVLSGFFAKQPVIFTLQLINIVAHLGIIFTDLFWIHILNIRQNSPRFTRFIYVCNFLLFFNMFFNISRSPLSQAIFYTSLLTITLSLFFYAVRNIRHNLYARYLSLARVITVVLIALNVLSTNHLISFEVWYPQLMIGNMVEMTILAFALGLKFRSFVNEKQKISVKLEMIERDMKFAKDVQKYLFPTLPNTTNHYKIIARYIPSASLCGDFYEFQEDGKGGFFLFIVDVSGHGFQAGLVASMVKVAYLGKLRSTWDMLEPLEDVNRVILQNTESSFLTAVHIHIDPARRKLKCVNCGHNPIIVQNREGNKITQYKPKGFPLGVIETNAAREILEIDLSTGSRVIIYTDGLTEETNSTLVEFGDARLHEALIEGANMDLDKMVDNTLKKLSTWKGGHPQEDDITIVAVEIS